MLKSLTRRLIVLFVLVAALAATAPSAGLNRYCEMVINPTTGECFMLCCAGSCIERPCQ
jgi:hypothetical protein